MVLSAKYDKTQTRVAINNFTNVVTFFGFDYTII